MNRWHITNGKGYSIESDGITVWINGMEGLIGRFGIAGIDIHRCSNDQMEHGECLYCTHTLTTAAHWPVFVRKMKELYNIAVPKKHKPTQFGFRKAPKRKTG